MGGWLGDGWVVGAWVVGGWVGGGGGGGRYLKMLNPADKLDQLFKWMTFQAARWRLPSAGTVEPATPAPPPPPALGPRPPAASRARSPTPAALPPPSLCPRNPPPFRVWMCGWYVWRGARAAQ